MHCLQVFILKNLTINFEGHGFRPTLFIIHLVNSLIKYTAYRLKLFYIVLRILGKNVTEILKYTITFFSTYYQKSTVY